jgi:hypothetical protein
MAHVLSGDVKDNKQTSKALIYMEFHQKFALLSGGVDNKSAPLGLISRMSTFPASILV